jgi:hypothetical protein
MRRSGWACRNTGIDGDDAAGGAGLGAALGVAVIGGWNRN